MILHNTVVVRGQTYFSGEWVNFDFNKLDPREVSIQQPMTWLHDHQIALRLALETGDTTPHWGTNRHILDIQGNNGYNKDIITHGQNIPVSQ